MKWLIILIPILFIFQGCMEKSYEKVGVKLEFQEFPSKYIYDGKNISPKIFIYGIDSKVKSIAIIMLDTDAPSGSFTHWLIWNIEAKYPNMTIPENIPKKGIINKPIKAIQGKNDFNKIGYDGPRPPPGRRHHYHFKVYGLDTFLTIDAGATKSELEKAMHGHIIQYGEAIATYKV